MAIFITSASRIGSFRIVVSAWEHDDSLLLHAALFKTLCLTMYGRDSLSVRRARVAIALATLIVAACGGSGSSAPTGPRPAISSFTASPSWVTAGQGATLSWSVSGATSLSVDGLGAVTGSSAQVTPAADTTYVLTASNEFGSTQAQTTLAVFRPR